MLPGPRDPAVNNTGFEELTSHLHGANNEYLKEENNGWAS